MDRFRGIFLPGFVAGMTGKVVAFSSELAQEITEDSRVAGDGEEEAIDGAPEVRRVADVVGASTRHVPAVKQVERREDVGGYGDGDQIDEDAHLRIEQDGGEEDGGNGAGRAHSVVGDVIPVLEEVADCGYGQGADIQYNVENRAVLRPENGPEILLHDRPEKVQGEHVEQQMPPPAVNLPVGKQLVPFPAMPYFIGVEHQRIDIYRPAKPQDADQAGDANDDEGNSDIHTLPGISYSVVAVPCGSFIRINGSPRASESFASEEIVKLGKPRVQRVIWVSLHPIFSANSLCVIPLRFKISAMLSMRARDHSISSRTAGDTCSSCL